MKDSNLYHINGVPYALVEIRHSTTRHGIREVDMKFHEVLFVKEGQPAITDSGLLGHNSEARISQAIEAAEDDNEFY